MMERGEGKGGRERRKGRGEEGEKGGGRKGREREERGKEIRGARDQKCKVGETERSGKIGQHPCF